MNPLVAGNLGGNTGLGVQINTGSVPAVSAIGGGRNAPPVGGNTGNLGGNLGGNPGGKPQGDLLTLDLSPPDLRVTLGIESDPSNPSNNTPDASGLLALDPNEGTTPLVSTVSDPTNTESAGPTTLDKVTTYRAPPCTTPACIQAKIDRIQGELDDLKIDREVLAAERKIQPAIETLDTLGNMGMAVGTIGCATASPGCAALPIGIAFKALKVLLTAAGDAQTAGIRGSDQTERLGVFVGSTAVGTGEELVKEALGAGVSKIAAGVVGKEAMETLAGGTFDAAVGMEIDLEFDERDGLRRDEMWSDASRAVTGRKF